MTQRVLLIDNHDSFTFNLVQLFEETGLCSVEVVESDSVDPLAVLDFEKIVVSPGPGIPSEAGRLMDVLRVGSPSKPILGICLGHQAIAEWYGGSLLRTPEVAHGVRKEIVLEGAPDRIFQDLPGRFSAGLYHSWAVDESTLPECLRVTARSTDGIIMALAHRTENVRGIQFHPESVMTQYGFHMIKNWLQL